MRRWLVALPSQARRCEGCPPALRHVRPDFSWRGEDCKPGPSMPKMAKSAIESLVMSLNVSLPVELENRVRERVASGMYGSASEVIREALRLFEAYQDAQSSSFAALRADLSVGLADANAGHVGPLDVAEIKARGRATLAARRKS